MKPTNGTLTKKQLTFCEQYMITGNATEAAIVAGYSEKTARVIAAENLSKPAIRKYIERKKDELAQKAGITKERILREYEKIAFSNIADLHNTWIDRKDFEALTADQRAAIAEIDTKINRRVIDKKIINVEQVKIKLHDKQRALHSITEMLGYDKHILERLSDEDLDRIIDKLRNETEY